MLGCGDDQGRVYLYQLCTRDMEDAASAVHYLEEISAEPTLQRLYCGLNESADLSMLPTRDGAPGIMMRTLLPVSVLSCPAYTTQPPGVSAVQSLEFCRSNSNMLFAGLRGSVMLVWDRRKPHQQPVDLPITKVRHTTTGHAIKHTPYCYARHVARCTCATTCGSLPVGFHLHLHPQCVYGFV